MLATMPAEDPAADSKQIRKELAPIIERLRVLLRDLERIADAGDFDDESRHA